MTLQEIKEEYAEEKGYLSWPDLYMRLKPHVIEGKHWPEIAERYAKEKVNEVLDKAAEEAQGAIECYPSEQEEIKKSILKLKVHSK